MYVLKSYRMRARPLAANHHVDPNASTLSSRGPRTVVARSPLLLSGLMNTLFFHLDLFVSCKCVYVV